MRHAAEHDRHRSVSEPEADAEIVRRLAARDFDVGCRDWVTLSEALVEYGYAVFMAWLIGGGVHRAASGHGRSGVRGLARVPRGLRLQEEDAHDLATTLLATAIGRFHRTLRDDLWRPEGGANLRTFFIGRCLMEFPDVYERWKIQQDRWAREVVDLADVDDGRFTDDPAEVAVAAVHLDEVLPPGEFEHVRVMLQLSQSGYTMADIAELFTEAGIPYSEAIVRTRISRARGWAKQRRRRDERGDRSE